MDRLPSGVLAWPGWGNRPPRPYLSISLCVPATTVLNTPLAESGGMVDKEPCVTLFPAHTLVFPYSAFPRLLQLAGHTCGVLGFIGLGSRDVSDPDNFLRELSREDLTAGLRKRYAGIRSHQTAQESRRVHVSADGPCEQIAPCTCTGCDGRSCRN